jgi:hypothetical protein
VIGFGVRAAEAQKIMECHTQNPGNAFLSGSTDPSARIAGRSFGYKWITGPLTTVCDGQRLPKAVTVTRISTAAWVWFSECSRCDTVVHGNNPYNVSFMENVELRKLIYLPQKVETS